MTLATVGRIEQPPFFDLAPPPVCFSWENVQYHLHFIDRAGKVQYILYIALERRALPCRDSRRGK